MTETFLQVTVMLMSLKAGNLGLNMVAACHVILLDLWWNPTTEDQAVDRAHRIGQTRPVTVSRITIKNTVEDRILAPSIGFVLSFLALMVFQHGMEFPLF
jgi:SNF2 family DNA or RNA helicase